MSTRKETSWLKPIVTLLRADPPERFLKRERRGKAPRRGLSLARPATAKFDAKYAAGRALDKIANPPIR
jgi:hypothetical protein